MPEGTVYVGRGSKYGNERRISDATPAITCKMLYRQLLEAREGDFQRSGRKFPGLPYYDDIRRELAGKDVACWCKVGEPCHADVLLEIANA